MIKKELQLFFATPIGYLVIGLFLLINSLFLFVFKTEFNILDAGFADLNAFFFLSPWIFIFLIAAVTMRSFSDEIQSGTIELLKTKPITNWQIVKSKYLSALILIIIALIPTLIFVFTLYNLSNPKGSIDLACIFGSYLGLLFLASSFVAIGIFSSALSSNQIVAFLITVCISFLLFYGFELIANKNISIQNFGMQKHYDSLSKGIIDSRDLVYFVSITILFLVLTKFKLDKL